MFRYRNRINRYRNIVELYQQGYLPQEICTKMEDEASLPMIRKSIRSARVSDPTIDSKHLGSRQTLVSTTIPEKDLKILSEIKEYVTERGHLPKGSDRLSTRLRNWINVKADSLYRGTLHPKLEEELEEIGGWYRPTAEHKEFRKEVWKIVEWRADKGVYPKCTDSNRGTEEFKLGLWIIQHKKKYLDNHLSELQKRKLDTVLVGWKGEDDYV